MDAFNPLVSIIIPVYNGSNYLNEAIDSALAQTYKKIEVLVINDGSEDGNETEQIVLSYGTRIRYFYKPNGGVASALNLGIEKMNGEYFSWLSHDDKYYNNKIEKQVERLKELSDKTTVIFSGWSVIGNNGKVIHHVLPLNRYSEKQLGIPLFALFHGQINGCSLLVHKSHFERVGLFNEQLPTTQDYDLWFRIMRNAKIVCCEDVLSMTRIHRQQVSKKVCKEHSAEADNLWIHMMDTLFEQEKININGSEYSFYKNIYCLMLSFSTNMKAAKYARHRACTELRKTNVCTRYYFKLVWLFLSGYGALVYYFFSSLKEVGILNTLKRVLYAINRLTCSKMDK